MQFNQDDDIWETADKQGMLEAKVKVGTNKLIKDSADGGFTLKDYTLSKGKDDKGHYISYYDKVDFAPSVMGMKIPIEKFVGNPYDFYGRMYYDPKTGQRIEPKESRGISRGVTGIDNLRTKQEGGEFQRLVKKYTTKGWASLNPQEQQFYRETYQKGGSLPSYQLKGSVNQKTLNPDIYGQRVLGNTPIDYRDPKLAQKLEDFKEISAQNKKEQAVLRAQLKREDDIRNRKFINEDISYKDDPDFFDRSAVLPGSNGKIKYSDYVKKKVYEGTHAYNPSTGALTKLQTPVSVDPLTSARSKKGAQQARIYADNPLAKKPSDITEEEMGAISHADRFKDLENLYKNPLWYAPAAIATAGTLGPAVLANPYVQAGLTGYGVYDAKTHSIPGAVQATKDGRYLDAAGNTGMAALDLLPIPYFGTNLIGEGKNLLKNVKNSKAFNRRAMDWTNDRPGLREDIREEAIKYYKLATSKENYARAKALDDKEGTKYVEGLDALKKQWLDYNKNVNSDKLPFNTHVIENPETGAGGYSGQLPPELKYKTGLHEFFGLGPKSGIDNRGVFLFDDATRGSIPRILPHEIKHHYTFANEGDDFYTKNPYYTQYSDLIHTPKSADEAGDPFLADMLEKKSFTNNPQTKSDYYRNPWEVDAYAFTNLKNHFVKEGITNSVFDKITVEDFYNFQKFGSKKGINKNFFKSIRKDKVKEFVKLWNESVYTAAPAIGAAGLMSNTLENNTNEGMRQKYRRGGRIKAQDGGSTDNKQFEIYQNYINGVFDEVSEEEAKQVYDKLNRMYYTQAKQQDMSPANFIMTHVIGNK